MVNPGAARKRRARETWFSNRRFSGTQLRLYAGLVACERIGALRSTAGDLASGQQFGCRIGRRSKGACRSMENIELITRATALFMILLALALAGRAAETLARAEGIGPLESGRAALVETAEVKREQVTETVTAFGVVAA